MPPWVKRYVGTPWRPPQWTCWQLVRTVYREQWGVALPAFSGLGDAISKEEARLIEATIHQEHMDWRCVVSGEAFREGDRAHDVGDVVVLNQMGRDSHVGVMVSPTRVLHVQATANTHVTDLMRMEWISRVTGIYRHRLM